MNAKVGNEPGQYRDKETAFLLQKYLETPVNRLEKVGDKIPLSPLNISESQYTKGFPIFCFNYRDRYGTTQFGDDE